MRISPPARRLRASSSIVSATPSPIQCSIQADSHTERVVQDVAGSIAVDELDPISDAEFLGAQSRLVGE